MKKNYPDSNHSQKKGGGRGKNGGSRKYSGLDQQKKKTSRTRRKPKGGVRMQIGLGRIKTATKGTRKHAGRFSLPL